MKIGRLRFSIHWFKPSKVENYNNYCEIIHADTYNTRGYIISFFYLHIFLDWWVKDGNPNEE